MSTDIVTTATAAAAAKDRGSKRFDAEEQAAMLGVLLSHDGGAMGKGPLHQRSP